jgi:hypothetical protein
MQFWPALSLPAFDTHCQTADTFALFFLLAEADAVRARHMKPAPFKYIAASSLDHALSLKAEHGEEARFLAGGQSLIPAMNFRLARSTSMVSMGWLASSRARRSGSAR